MNLLLPKQILHSKPINNFLKYFILQDSKRLRTFQVPQENAIHPVPKQVFDDACILTLIRLQAAFEKLKAQQNGINNSTIKSIQLQGISKLQIQSAQGWFIFQGKQELSTFFYTSPFNGVFKYYYDLDSKRWLSNKDKHVLQENVSRQVQGKFFSYLDI